jgi:hypothetical protein
MSATENFDEQSDALFRKQLSVMSIQDVLCMLSSDIFNTHLVDARQHSIGLDDTMMSDPLVIVSTNTQMSPPITYVIYKDLCGNTTGNRIEFVDGHCVHYKFDGYTETDAENTEIPVDNKTIDMMDNMSM